MKVAQSADEMLSFFDASAAFGRATPDLTQFGVGLRVCGRIAGNTRGSIVVLADGQRPGPLDCFDEQHVAAQVRVLEETSREHPVHLIVYSQSAEPYRRYISGYAISVYLGSLDTEEASSARAPGANN
jgi:hypothetical protein